MCSSLKHYVKIKEQYSEVMNYLNVQGMMREVLTAEGTA